jgi:anti-sigma factor (TIGR02949 family)
MEISCREVIHEISNYIDHELDPRLREAIAAHLTTCDHCTAVFDGARNVIRLVCDERTFTLPAGFSQRLYGRLAAQGMEN